MRFGCLFSVILSILAFAVMGFFMLPLMFEGNETVMEWQAAVLCKSGETFTTDFRTQTDLRGTVRGGQVYCVDESGDYTNVTGKSIVYAGGGFAVFFIIGLVFGMRSIARTAQDGIGQLLQPHMKGAGAGGTVRVSSGSYQIDPGKVDVNALLKQFGVEGADLRQIDTGSGRTLTEQLKDLQTAYDKQLITREEYERLRQEIINNITRSS